MSPFKTQQGCWSHVVNGDSIFLSDITGETKGTEIKFIDGALKSYMNGEWMFCPVSFENPKLFSC